MKDSADLKKYVGRGKITQSLRIKLRTLEELRKETLLTKPTILHHLKDLTAKGFVKFDKKQKRYQIEINENLRNLVLESFREESTLDEAFENLSKQSKLNKNNTELSFIIKSKGAKLFLKGLVEFFYDQRLMTKISNRWGLSWLGCTKINVCYVCKNNFSSQDVAVSQTMNLYNHEQDMFDEYYAPLIHPKCFMRKLDPQGFEVYEDFCSFCGLPLSKERFLNLTNKTENFLEFIEKYLETKERSYLKKYIKNKIIDFSNEHLEISLTNDDITINTDYKIVLSINKEDVNILVKINENRKLFSGYFEDKVNYYCELKTLDFIDGLTYHNPSLGDIEYLFQSVNEFSNLHDEATDVFSRYRAKAIFLEWYAHKSKTEENFDQLLENPISKSYSLINHNNSNKSSNSEDTKTSFFDKEFSTEKSQGFSFVCLEDNKFYHPYCFEKKKHLFNQNVTNIETDSKQHKLDGNNVDGL